MKSKGAERDDVEVTEREFKKRFKPVSLNDLPPAVRKLRAASKRKTRVTIYFDNDVLSRFRELADAEGLGYQTLINRVLRDAVESNDADTPSEKVKEELLRDKKFIRKLKNALAA